MGTLPKRLRARVVLACAGVVLLLTTLSARLLYIESVDGERLSAMARSHYEFKEILPATRGRIYDREGELLARSQTVYSLKVDAHHLRDLGLACIGLARAEGRSPQAIRRAYLPEEILSRYREYVATVMSEVLETPQPDLARRLRDRRTGNLVLLRGIEDDYARQLNAIIEERALRGLYLQRGERRYYPSPMSLTQVIGYTDADGRGVSGIEKTCDEVMTGTPGYRYCERDNRRREIHAYRGLQVDPVPGQDVHLTVHMGLQSIVERELDAVIDLYRPEKVSTVWLCAETGEVLAMASRPHFDLATRRGIRGAEPVRRNIAVSDFYEPGSTFKIVGFAGAFDRGLVNPMTEIDCHMGSYRQEGFELRDHHPYGRLTAQMAFAKSSNIGAYLVARPLNQQGFHRYIEEFGFGRRTGIELTGESAGRVLPLSRWNRTSFSSQVKGYEVAVTPLQMAAACAVVASGGVYREPTIVRGFSAGQPGSSLRLRTPATRRVISERAARQLKDCMVVATGDECTASRGVFPGYTVAGKTGTARKHVEGFGYVAGRYVASFVGFLPADAPKLVGLVMIDDPNTEGYNAFGGTTAAPVFARIAQDAVKVLGIDPDKPEELEELEKDFVSLIASEERLAERGEQE